MINKLKPKSEFSRNVLTLMTGTTIAQAKPIAVHYPMPLHLQECFSYLGYKKGDFPIAERVSKEIMSLPMNPYLSDEEIEYISKILKSRIDER
jgi:dTDP-4-amino-4,6-dideoxygalactose transaminase